MHETIFAKSVLKDVKDIDKINEIHLELGEVVGITSEELKNGINNLYPDIKTIITPIETIGKCSNCNYKGRVKIIQRLHDIVIFGCGNEDCDQQPKIISGGNIKIKKVIYK